jgi:hypothetical protein
MPRGNFVPRFRPLLFPYQIQNSTPCSHHNTHPSSKMVPTHKSLGMKAAGLPIANAGFRLGEDHISDASDSDQSAHTDRNLPLLEGAMKVSKTKKKKDRKQVGALTEELDDLLSAAFQTPNGEIETADNVVSGTYTLRMETMVSKILQSLLGKTDFFDEGFFVDSISQMFQHPHKPTR